MAHDREVYGKHSLDELREIARRRDIKVWPLHFEDDPAPFCYRKGNVEVGSIIAFDEARVLLVLMPDLDPLVTKAEG
jgi:hypothetical protein